MKKQIFIVLLSVFFSINASYCQTYIKFISNGNNNDSVGTGSSYACNKALFFEYYMYGIAKGYNQATDSITIRLSFGDGVDTIFRAFIYNDSLFAYNVWGYHHYVNIGIYNLKWLAIAPDYKKDSIEYFNFLVGNICDSVRGTLYIDNNLNCINNSEPIVQNGYIVSLLYNNQLVMNTYFDHNYSDKYSFYVPTGFNYDVVLANNVNAIFCPTSIPVTTAPSLHNDFGYQCNNHFDLSGTIIPEGHIGAYITKIYAFTFNYGCIPVSGETKLVYDNTLLTPISIHPSAPISGDTIIWNFANLNGLVYSQGNIFTPYAVFQISPSAQMGDTLCFTTIEMPIIGDIFPSDNIQHSCLTVQRCLDPNEKQVTPQGVGISGLIDNNLTMAYSIHFQNTGNAFAQNIYIIDTLNSNLDIGTFSIVYSSHYMVYSFIGNHIVKFNFPYINLPDSGTNQNASNGGIIYSIRQLPNLAPGTVITNKAYIYFDYNPAIATNTTINTIQSDITGKEIISDNGFILYPNPANDKITIEIPQPTKNAIISIYNTTGQLLLQQALQKPGTEIDISSFAKGLYIIKLSNAEGVVVKKFIKE